jgi:mono/diheme cytochrome c family protein
MKHLKKTVFASMLAALVLVACSDPNSPGVEYMPDMYRSPAIETYVDYNYPDSATSRKAPENAIPRGYLPYPYQNNDEGLAAASENLKNPLNLTEKSIQEGKVLYTSFCAHCHGKEGKGEGSIQNPIYGAVPSYLDETPNRRLGTSMKNLTEGHIYHTIMYGLNAMGPHSSLIRENDRWKIVAYVQTLQRKDPLKTSTETAQAEATENDSLK